MPDELFPLSEVKSDSPRLRWMKRFQATVTKMESGRYHTYIDEDTWGVGATEEEALLDLIEMARLPHWNKGYFAP